MSYNKYDSNLIGLSNYITTNYGLSNKANCDAENINILSYINCGSYQNNPTVSDFNTILTNLVSNISNDNYIEDDIMPLLVLNDFSLSNNNNTNYTSLAPLLLNVCSGNANTNTNAITTLTNLTSYNCSNYNNSNYNNKLINSSNGFNLYDFNYNIKNCDVFDMDLNLIDNKTKSYNNYIFDMDLSKYLSQSSLVYLFLLDTLYFIYNSLSNNLITKQNIDNSSFNIPTNYKCVYDSENNKYTIEYINRKGHTAKSFNKNNYMAKIPTTFKLNLKNIFSCNLITNVNTSSVNATFTTNDINDSEINNLLYFIRKSLDKHVQFIKNNDIVYAHNFAIFFKTTKVMFLNNILSYINYMLYNDMSSTKISSLTSYLSSGVDKDHSIILKNPIDYTFNYISYNNLFKFDNSDSSNYISSFIIQKSNLSFEIFSYHDIFIKTSLEELNSTPINDKYSLSFDNYNIISTHNLRYFPDFYNPSSTIINSNSFYYCYVPFYKNSDNTIKYISAPISYYFKYDNSTIKINLDSTNFNIISIQINTGFFVNNSEYYIKLHNFSSIENTYTITSADSVISTGSNTIRWNNLSKVLYLKCNNAILTNIITVDISKPIYYIDLKTNSSQILTGTIITDTTKYISFVNTGISFTNTSKISNSDSEYDTKIRKYDNNLYIAKISTFNTLSGLGAGLNLVYTTTLPDDPYFYNKSSDTFITPKNLISYKHTGLDSNNTFITFMNNYLPSQLNLRIDNINGIVPTCWYNIASNNTNAIGIAEKNNFNMDLIITNLKGKIKNEIQLSKTESTEIISEMNKIHNLNNNITSTTTFIKKNYNDYLKQNNKLVSINIIELISIIIFVISITLNIFIILVDNKKITLPLSIFIFIIIFIIFIYLIISIIYNNNKENFTLTSSGNNYNYNYSNAEFFNEILGDINTLLSYQQYSIAQSLIKPRITKEKDLYTLKNTEYNTYNTISYNDTDIIKLTQTKKNSQILLLINLSMALSLCTFLYVLYPDNKKILIGLLIFLIIIIICIYFYQSMNRVRTSSNKYYWSKPSNHSLSSLQ